MSDDYPEASLDSDLFGNPSLPIRDRRGRPSFKKDKQNQDFVAVRIAAGWTQKQIAANMSIDEKTLRKYFSRELDNGAVLIEGVALDVLLRRTREGHAPSVRQLREVLVDGRRRSADRQAGESVSQPADTERRGKKELNQERALAADEELMAELEREASQNGVH